MVGKISRRLVALLMLFPITALSATDYPTRPIKLVLGYAAGGSADIVARKFAQELAEKLKQSVVVENRGGASGTIGAQAVVNAQPDGYTLYFVASPTVTLTPALQKVSFDPIKDFSSIASIVDYVSVLTVDAESPYENLNQIVEKARAEPGSVTFGSSGVGSASHLAGEILADKANVEFTHVPYKGNAPALTDLMAGRLAFVFDLTTTALNNVNNGQLRALAVTSAERNPMFPDVPTMAESGFEDFTYTSWFGLLGPAGMDDAVVSKLASATREVVDDQSFNEQMLKSGYLMNPSGPDDLKKRIALEGQAFSDLVSRLNLN